MSNEVDVDNYQYVNSHTHINHDKVHTIDANIYDDIHGIDSYANPFYVEDSKIDNNFYQTTQHA